MALLDHIYSTLTTFAGFAFAMTLVGFIYKRDAIHWQYLAKAYGRPWGKPIRERWGNAVLYGKYPVSKCYNGILKIGIHADGLALRIGFLPIALFCQPLFIPFKDLRGWDQTWYLNARTIEFELKQAPEVKLVMPRDQVEWIKAAGGSQIALTNQASPHRDKPVLWHAFLVANMLLSVFVLVYVLFPKNLI